MARVCSAPRCDTFGYPSCSPPPPPPSPCAQPLRRATQSDRDRTLAQFDELKAALLARTAGKPDALLSDPVQPVSLMDDGLPPISALASKIITPLVNLWTYPQLRVELTRKDVGLVSSLFALLRRSAEVDDDSVLTSDGLGDGDGTGAGASVCSLEELHWVIQLLLALVVAPGWRDKEQLREFGVAWTCLESVRVVASHDHPNILVQQWKRMQHIADRLRASGMGGAKGSGADGTAGARGMGGSASLASSASSSGDAGGDAAATVVRTLPQLAQTEHDLLLLLHALLKSPVEALRMARETDLLSMFSNLLCSLRDVHAFTTERDRHELSSVTEDFDRLGDEPTTSTERCGSGSRSAEFATLCVLSDALGALFAWLGPGELTTLFAVPFFRTNPGSQFNYHNSSRCSPYHVVI